MKTESNWFPMSNGDFYSLIIILTCCAMPFFFIRNSSSFLGLSIFGWIMGLLMFFAPVISLVGIAFDEKDIDG